MATCNVCGGSGGHWAYPKGEPRYWVKCFKCNGTGQR